MNRFADLPKVEIHGHQEFWEGRFHGWGIGENVYVPNKGLQTMAIVEHEDGRITLEAPQKVYFKDTRVTWLNQGRTHPIAKY